MPGGGKEGKWKMGTDKGRLAVRLLGRKEIEAEKGEKLWGLALKG